MPASLTLPSHAVLRRFTQVVAGIGVIWGAIPVLVALDVLDENSALLIGSGRIGWGLGVAELVAWLCAIAGVVIVMNRTALAAALIFIAALAGFLLLGGMWIGPGILLGIAAWSALLGIDNPFEDEMRQERAAADAPEV